MDMKKMLWITNVGSHMWNMQTENSDIDLFEAWQFPTKDILLGFSSPKSKQETSRDVDKSIHEIGKIIIQLIKGNVNFYWGVMSPKVINDANHHLRELRKVVGKNLSKNLFHSIEGLALHNYNKYIDPYFLRLDGRDNSEFGEKMEKKLKIIIRTLKFGTCLFEKHKFDFSPINKDVNVDIFKTTLQEFYKAFCDCSLPEKPNEELYREYLYQIRLDDLNAKN